MYSKSHDWLLYLESLMSVDYIKRSSCEDLPTLNSFHLQSSHALYSMLTEPSHTLPLFGHFDVKFIDQNQI